MNRFHYWKRFLKGFMTSLRIMMSYRFLNLLGIFISPEEKSIRIKKLHKKNAVLIRQKAIEMKGVMIKVGQFLSSRIDLLPDEYTEELSQLQDKVPPHDYGEISQQIIDEFGMPPEEIFADFNHVPIAAASLGQVHKAMLRNGRQVAVKVQYPDIHRIIEIDIKMFWILIKVLRGRYGRINLELLHEEFTRIVRAELDYIQEGKNAERFRKDFMDDTRIIFPEVIWDFTRKKVLTLEYVGGIKITECDAVKTSGIDCRETINLLAETYSKMIFVHGFFHGDPHPGNIFVREGPTLVFVDFGMVQAIPDTLKRDLRRFANFIVESDSLNILNSLEHMGFIIEGADYRALEGLIQSLIDKYRSITPEALKALTIDQISDDIEEFIGVMDYVQIPNNFILLGRTIGMLNGIAYRLNPEVNMIEIGKPYIKEFLRGSGREQTQIFIAEVQKKAHQLWELPSQLSEFLVKANRGDLSVKLAKSEIEQIIGQFRTLTSVLMIVILTVIAASASLFFMIIGSKPLSIAAAAATVVLGLVSVVRLMKS